MTNHKKRIEFRIKLLSAIFALWLFAVLVMLFNIGVFNQAAYIKRGDDISVRQFFIPPVRGTIMDLNRVPLSWTVKYFDLMLTRPDNYPEERQRQLFDELALLLPEFSSSFLNLDDLSSPLPAYQDLPAAAVLELQEIMAKYPELAISMRMEREVYDHPSVRKVIGEVEEKNGASVGISGLEQKFNKTLSGVAEIYEIMLNKHGKPLMNTRKILQNSQLGDNVILPYTVEDIINANRDGERANDEN